MVSTIEDLQDYVYWSVMVPFMGLSVSTNRYNNGNTPLKQSSTAKNARLVMCKPSISDSFPHRYLRDLAYAERDTYLLVINGSRYSSDRFKPRVAGKYDRKTHVFHLYSKAFTSLKNGGILMSVLEKRLTQEESVARVVFDTDTKRESLAGVYDGISIGSSWRVE